MDAATSHIQQFGRAYELTVSTTTGEVITLTTTAWEPEALAISFEVSQNGYQAFWFADISVYNLNSPTEQKVLRAGMDVVLKAGYQAGPYGEIFRGKIFQPLWEREGVTDYKITLHCVVGLDEITNNYVSMSHSRYATQADLIARMAAAAHNPLEVQYLDREALSKKQLPRGKAIFGAVGKYFNQIAVENKMSFWYGPQGVNIGPFGNAGGTPLLTYGPGTGLLGTPQQTQDGVSFRTNLDSRIGVRMPATLIKLDFQSIRQAPQTFGQYFGVLAQDATYAVLGVRHVGDSRGNTWDTEVTGVTTVGGVLAMLGETQDLDPRAGGNQ